MCIRCAGPTARPSARIRIAYDVQDPLRRHELDRSQVREVVCSICSLQQPVATNCSGCHVQFGAYSCLKCNFFDDDTSKQQFHCDLCGLCRVGGAENFFHCNRCGCCYGKSLQVCSLEPFSCPPASVYTSGDAYTSFRMQLTCMCTVMLQQQCMVLVVCASLCRPGGDLVCVRERPCAHW